MVKIPEYPKLLDAGEWKKNQGSIAKLKGKTGLDEVLKKAESAYVKFQNSHHDNQIALCNNSSQVTKVGDVAAQTSRALEGALLESEKLALKFATEYKDSAFVGKTTREYVEKIAKAAGKKFRDDLEVFHMQFVKACLTYYKQPSIIGGDIVQLVKEASVALPKFAKLMEVLGGLAEKGTPNQELESKFCSSLGKFAGETPRSLAVQLLEYQHKSGDSEVAQLVPLWGDPGKMRPKNLEEARTFLKAVDEALGKSTPMLKKKGFRV